MGGFASIVRGGLAGLNEAGGNTQTAQALEAANQRQRDAQMDELRARVLPHSLAIKGLQTKLEATDDVHERAAITHDIARNLAEVRGIIHPDKDPTGNFFERGITDKLHLSSLKARQDKLKQQQAKGQAQDESSAQAYEQGSVPYQQDPKFLQDMALEKARQKAALPKYENVKLSDGSITAIDTAHYPIPPGSTIVGKTTTSGVARVIGRTSTQDALSLIRSGTMQFPLANGQNITAEQLQSMPPYMELTQVRQGDKDIYYPTDQRTHISTVGNVRYQVPDVGGVIGNATDLGQARTPTASTDPFGVTTTSTPASPGMTAPGQPSSQPTAGESTPPKTPIGHGHAQLQQTRQGQTAGVKKQLDANGDIPATDKRGNDMLRGATNQYIHGVAMKDLQIPEKDKPAVNAWAHDYGYEQGAFTPRELSLVQESRSLIDKIKDDPSFNDVYSADPFTRGTMVHLINMQGEQSFTGAIGSSLASSTLSPGQIKFIQTYRQLIGRIQGLAQLTRGSGRPTEAAIQRMIGELPDPAIVQSPEEARHSFELIQNEIDTALKTVRSSGSVQPSEKSGEADNSQVNTMVQHSRKTGKYRYSTDGGKTWHPGQPPPQ